MVSQALELPGSAAAHVQWRSWIVQGLEFYFR